MGCDSEATRITNGTEGRIDMKNWDSMGLASFLKVPWQTYLASRNSIRTWAGKSNGCPLRIAGRKRISFAA